MMLMLLVEKQCRCSIIHSIIRRRNAIILGFKNRLRLGLLWKFSLLSRIVVATGTAAAVATGRLVKRLGGRQRVGMLGHGDVVAGTAVSSSARSGGWSGCRGGCLAGRCGCSYGGSVGASRTRVVVGKGGGVVQVHALKRVRDAEVGVHIVGLDEDVALFAEAGVVAVSSDKDEEREEADDAADGEGDDGEHISCVQHGVHVVSVRRSEEAGRGEEEQD